MVCNFRLYGFIVILLAAVWLMVVCIMPIATYGAWLDDLCTPDTDGGYDIPSLSEEAEAAGMPPRILRRLLAKGYGDNAPANELGRLLCLIVQAEEEGFLPDLLFLKLEEGLAKNASLSSIKLATERKIEDMVFAQRLISGGGKPKPEDENVMRIARAMSAGLTRQELQSLFTGHKDVPVDMRVTAAEIMAYGGAIGYDARLLDRIVISGLTSRSLRDEWSFFVKVIAKARKRKIPDRLVAEKAIETLSHNRTLNDLILGLGMKPADVY